MQIEKFEKIDFKESINKENVIISEYDNDEICWFKCKTKTNLLKILNRIKNKNHQMEINPLLIDIIREDKNIFHYNLKSPAPLLGIPEQKFSFKYIQKGNLVHLFPIKNTNFFEDSETNKIEYFRLQIINQFAEIYAVIKPSQLLPGNKHIIHLRNFFFYFLKSIQ